MIMQRRGSYRGGYIDTALCTMLYPPLASGLTRQSRHGHSIDWLLEVDRGILRPDPQASRYRL